MWHVICAGMLNVMFKVLRSNDCLHLDVQTQEATDAPLTTVAFAGMA
jgi:hypothetical protein